MPDDDLRHYPKAAPETEEDWQRLHRAAYRSDMSWKVTRPMVAFATNWKAWVFLIGLFAALRRTELLAVLDLVWRK